MKKACLLFCLFVQTAFAQNIILDSLEKEFAKATSDDKRMELMKELTNRAFESDLEKALAYAKRGVALAEKVDDKKQQPVFYEMEGRMHANMLHLDSAMAFFDKASAGYKAVDNKRGEATTLFKIAWVYKKRQEIEKAMTADMQALKLMEGLNDPDGIGDALSRVSDDLTRQGRLKEALDYSKQAINILEKNNLQEQLMYAYFNAGNVSINMGNPDSALFYYDKAIAVNLATDGSEMNLSDFSNARGNALKRLNRYQEALVEYKKAQALAEKANYTNAKSTVIANLGEINLLLGNYAEALKYQLQTVQLMEAAGDMSNLVENYIHVSTIYEKLSNYPLALDYQKKARRLRDSTATKESDAAMSELLTKYETEKKQATIAAQQQQLSQKNRLQWLSIGVAALLGVLLLLGFFSYRSRTRSNKLLAAKNAENELLLKEIHHRVKNNLEVVSSLLELQSAQIDDPNTKEAMQEGQNRVQSIGIVHQKLYQGENLGAIEMKDYFINLSENILDSFGAEKRVEVECVGE